MTWLGIGQLVTAIGLVLLTGLYWWETRRLRKESRSPKIVVYTEHTRDKPTIIQIVIRNVGAGMAREIKFAVDTGGVAMPSRAFGIEGLSDPPRVMSKGPLFTGIPALGPHTERRLDWGQFGGLKQSLGDRKVYVTTTFVDDDGKQYTTYGILEVDSFEETVADDHPLNKIARKVDEIAQTLRSRK